MSGLGWFGKKKDGGVKAGGDTGAPAGGAGASAVESASGTPEGKSAPAFTPSPEKAKRFFDHARTVHDATNYEYAMQLWLRGLRQDPTSMHGLKQFFESATAFVMDAEKSKKGLSKDTLKAFAGGSDLERYLRALLDLAIKPLDPVLGVRACEAALKLGLVEPAKFLARSAIGALGRDKRPRKDLYIKLMEIFQKLGDFQLAVDAAAAAKAIDPTDSELEALWRNLTAQATMTKGGYEQTGQAGGFRANVRDIEKQRQLEERERIVKTEDVVERVVRDTRAAFEQRPDDLPTVDAYVKALLERGTVEDQQLAMRVCDDTYEKTRQFRFRERSGEIKLRLERRKVEGLKAAAEARPGDTAAAEAYRRAQAALLKAEIDEWRLRVDAYPTDLARKFELGRRLFEAGEYHDAIAMFQESQHDNRYRAASLGLLAEAFDKIGWVDEGVEYYRKAIDGHAVAGDETGLKLRYGLMSVLQRKAETEGNVAAAEEADRIASAIAMQQFGYRDIRSRRDEIRKLVASLRARAGGG